MISPSLPTNEQERLKVLSRYDILDSLPEEDFDDITHLASYICQTPISQISIIDSTRQYIKSSIGMPITETNREFSFCVHAINQPNEIFEVEDARIDKRFHDNPLVTGHPTVVFYAGVRLVTHDGFALGALCVIDHKPRHLSEEQRDALKRLSKQVMSLLGNREKKKNEERLNLLDYSFRNLSTPMVFLTEDGSFLDYNQATLNMLGFTREELSSKKVYDINPNLTKENWAIRWADLKERPNQTIITNFTKRDGSVIDLEVRTNLIKLGDIDVHFSFYTDITEKKKLEDELRLSEVKYKYLFENIPYPMMIWEFGTLNILDVNKAATEIYGYSKEEFTQLNIRQIRPEEDIPLIEAVTKDTKTYGIDHHRIWRHQKKNGDIMYMEVSAHVLNLNGKQVSINHNQDVTERLKAENALKESEKRYIDLFYYSPLPKWLYDPVSLNFVQVNKAAIENYGYTEEEFLELTILDIRPTEDIEKAKEVLKTTLGQKGIYVGEFRHCKKTGEIMDVEIYSNTIPINGKDYILIVALDITEKKKQEERLLEMEKVVTETSQSVVIADADENLDTPILYANDAFTNITGYTLKEAKGMNPRILHRDMDVNDDAGRAIMRSAIRHLVPWKVEVLNRKKNGEHYWAEISGFPLFDKKKGKYTRWVAMQTDITDRKNAEDEREKLVNELVENNKELTHFSYIVSHNLRAPLTNLVLISNLIEVDKIEDERTLKLINGFKISTNFLNETLNDLIKVLVIKESPNWTKETIDLEGVFNKVKNSLNYKLLEMAATVKADFSEAPSVVFSKEYMESIFLNLMTNSLRYSHPTRYPVIDITSKTEANGSVKLIFSDNGIGMDLERVKNKIFKLYQRFHDNPEGKGMGLFLVHSQVTALGGKIDVESEEGVGTKFIITFKN